MYKLKVEKVEINEDYQQEIKEYNEKQRYTQLGIVPDPMRTERVLEVEVTPAEFLAIKKAVIEAL